MNVSTKKFELSALALAISGVLVGMSAYAQEEDVAALKKPTNVLELGVIGSDKGSAKFGEYTGLNKAEANLVGNLNMRGGSAYDNLENGGVGRWSVIVKDIGLTSRSLGASVSEQGRWNVSVDYDELTHFLTDTYKTPYLGSAGGNSFTLPTSYTTSLVTLATTLTPAQIAALHQVDISTTRKNTTLRAGVALDSRWSLDLDFNHLDQTGSKLLGVAGMGGGGVTGESIAILPMPTNYSTDSVTLGTTWIGEKARFNASYYGSIFSDANSSMAFSTFMGAVATQHMPTPPSNQFHQLNLGGGYEISDATKLVGNLSYARNTQDSAFVIDPLMFQGSATSPLPSMGGVVVNTHLDLKVTNQTLKNLVLSGAVKFDERDNQSPSNIYLFNAVDGSAHGELYPNTPLSTKKTLYQVAGDYRIKQGQNFRLELNHEEVNRWCNNYAVSTIYVAGTNCVVAKSSLEDKLDTNYKLKLSEDVDFKVGYSYADRQTNSDVNARAAFVSTNGIALPVATVPAGSTGLNAGDFRGFYPFFDASRVEQAIKLGGNWQASEKLAITLGTKFTDDKYGSTYGVTKGSSWSANLDANYAYAEKSSFYGYLTQQHRQRDLTDIAGNKVSIANNPGVATLATSSVLFVPTFATWTNKLTDDDVTIGLGAKQGGLMGGKLELSGDIAYTLGSTVYGTQFNYASATTTPGLTCASSVFLTCGDLPAIRSESTQVKLTGTYDLDKKSKVVVRYVYQVLSASDYYYNTYQVGNVPKQVLPTNQQAGSYENNAIAVAYMYNF